MLFSVARIAQLRIPLIADSDSILIVDSVPRDGGHLARES